MTAVEEAVNPCIIFYVKCNLYCSSFIFALCLNRTKGSYFFQAVCQKSDSKRTSKKLKLMSRFQAEQCYHGHTTGIPWLGEHFLLRVAEHRKTLHFSLFFWSWFDWKRTMFPDTICYGTLFAYLSQTRDLETLYSK